MTLMLALGIIAFVLSGVVCLLAWRVKPKPERKDLLEAIEAMPFDAAERAEQHIEAYWERIEEAEERK